MDLDKLESKEVLQLVEKHFGVGCMLVCKERLRHIEKEGWDNDHDDEHTNMCLSTAGASYALDTAAKHAVVSESWKGIFKKRATELFPFDDEWFKPTPDDPKRQLTKAASLIVADIDRIHRI